MLAMYKYQKRKIIINISTNYTLFISVVLSTEDIDIIYLNCMMYQLLVDVIRK